MLMRHDLSLQKRIVKWRYFFHSGMMGIRSIVCTKVLWHFTRWYNMCYEPKTVKT